MDDASLSMAWAAGAAPGPVVDGDEDGGAGASKRTVLVTFEALEEERPSRPPGAGVAASDVLEDTV